MGASSRIPDWACGDEEHPSANFPRRTGASRTEITIFRIHRILTHDPPHPTPHHHPLHRLRPHHHAAPRRHEHHNHTTRPENHQGHRHRGRSSRERCGIGCCGAGDAQPGWAMNALDTRKAIQAMLAVTPDGDFGKLTRSALATLAAAQDDAPWPPLASAPSQDVSSGIHHVKASSFADRGDVAAFQRCRDRGNSEQFCFSKGDNGQGFGGLTDCTDETIPYVALPPDYWKPRFGTRENAIGKPVVVSIGNQTFVCKI